MISIRAKIMIVALASVLASVAVFAVLMIASLQTSSRADETERLRRNVQTFNERMSLREQGALAVLQMTAGRHDVIDAVIASDREALMELLRPAFEELQDTLGIVEFNVHRPDGAVLLRVHDPQLRGDSYASHRAMIVDAVRTGEVTRGIELDSGRMSHRTVLPVLHDGEIEGLLEVGLEYDAAMLQDMKERSAIDSRIWLLLDAAGPSGLWPEGDALESPVPGMFIYASTYGTTRLMHMDEYEMVATTRQPVTDFDTGDHRFAAIAVPIMAYGNKQIGVLEISQSRAQAIAALRSSLAETILVAALVAAGGMLLLGLTLSVVVLRPLRGLTRAAHRQFEGDLTARAPRYSNDELGLLADTFNGLSNRLNETLQQQQQSIEELGAARQLAEQASAAKDQFLAVLSHELRTPMTPVLLAVEALQEDNSLSPSARADLELIGRNVQLEARLIDDLLDLTKITQGKLELHLHKADLHALIGFAASVCRQDVEQKRIRLTRRLDATHSWVFADAPRLQQVVWNLLKNAVKFTPMGGEVAIETSDEREDGRIVLRVRDNGIGMTPETVARIFQPFEQGGRDITRTFGGLGLGLVISKRIVELHGGTITAHSAGRGKGSEFLVRLPVVAAPEAPHRTGPAPQEAKAVRSMRILLVEDHAATAEMLARVLRAAGHSVMTANSMAAAIEAADSTPLDLLISDLGLPDGSGTDLLEKLRRARKIQAIAISGYGMQDDVDRSARAGFAAHLVKPITRELLLSEIDRLAAQAPVAAR